MRKFEIHTANPGLLATIMHLWLKVLSWQTACTLQEVEAECTQRVINNYIGIGCTVMSENVDRPDMSSRPLRTTGS